ncbi:tetratricopeptide repeat protein [Rummeliibacillus pycnus]|uniref:tetratricopeptide repeat protein n=1 Tax=Rummeliibacillus pycnus TaxID=101070 RepID=UPI003D27BC1D
MKSEKNTRKNVVSFIPNGEFYYKKAVQALNRDQDEKALKYLRRAAELSPEDSLILLQYAIVEMEAGRIDHALELLRKANEIDPNEPEILLFLAEGSAQVGLTEDAKYFAEEYLRLDEMGEYADEAIDIIDFATSIEENSPPGSPSNREVVYLQEKARKLMELGKLDEAIEILENIIIDQPDFWAAYNNLSLAYFYKGESEQARALLYEVLQGDYGNLHALCNLTVMAYYEKDEEELQALTELLVKLSPFSFEHRYKLGATLALIGCYQEAYKWLRSMKRQGFEDDPGYYFWFSHAAYFSGFEEEARSTWAKLIEIDPEKDGYEPWAMKHTELDANSIELNRDFIVEKLESEYRSERLLGIFLVGKSPHQQEILAHPSWIQVDNYSAIEKLFLAYTMDHDFLSDDGTVKPFLRSVEVAEILYKFVEPMKLNDTFLFQMWFVLCERALENGYPFKNPNALAAATEYMYKSSRMKNVTKKSVAAYYGISTATLTKYVNELIQFLPLFDK